MDFGHNDLRPLVVYYLLYRRDIAQCVFPLRILKQPVIILINLQLSATLSAHTSGMCP